MHASPIHVALTLCSHSSIHLWQGIACVFFFCFSFLRPHLWHMEVSRLGVKSELQLPAYATVTATLDLTETPLWPTLQFTAMLDLNPLSKGKD